MNTYTTAHPDPSCDVLVVATLPDAITLKFGKELTIILSERDPEEAETWLRDASLKLAEAARKMSVRAAIRATA